LVCDYNSPNAAGQKLDRRIVAVRLERAGRRGLGCTHAVRTVEESAVYGVIDAQTYIELSDAVIAGTATVRDCFPMLDREMCERIRTQAGEI
jgi:hypothetical protein